MDARSLAGRALRRLSIARDRILPPSSGVSILIYHRVGGRSDSSVDIDVGAFVRQLEHLRENCRVVTLDEAVRGLSREDSSVDGSVVITFDDGTADFADTVVPLLVEHHLPATLYVATSFVDEQQAFPWGAPPLSWSALGESVSTGLVTIGSHTHTHRLLDRVDAAVAVADIDRSMDLIEARLGRPPKHFAYPKALLGSAPVQRVVVDRFQSAAIARSHVNRVGRTDLHRLCRTPVQRDDTLDVFRMKAAGGMRLEGSVRAATAGLRNRHASQ